MSRFALASVCGRRADAHSRRGGDHDDRVETLIAAGLVEQRNLDRRDRRRVGALGEVAAPCSLFSHHLRMEQLLEPVELGRVVEDDARDRRPIRPTLADHLLAEALRDLAQNLRIAAEQAVDDLVARSGGGAVTGERLERGALAGADSTRDRDCDRALRVSARRKRARREPVLRRALRPDSRRPLRRSLRSRVRPRRPPVHAARRAPAPAAPTRNR